MNPRIIKNHFPYEEYKKAVAEIDKPIENTQQAVEILNNICKVTKEMVNIDTRDGNKYDFLQSCKEVPHLYNMELSGKRSGVEFCIHLLFLKLEKVMVSFLSIQ